MEYFTEYFADAGPENEQAVIEELGTPKIAAAELMMNLLDKKMDEHTAMEQEEKRNEKKKTTGASVNLDRRSHPVCGSHRSTGSDQCHHCPALRGALCGVVRHEYLSGRSGRRGRRNKAAAAGNSGSYGFLRRIFSYHRNGHFTDWNQYFVYCVRRIPCKMDGMALCVVRAENNKKRRPKIMKKWTKAALMTGCACCIAGVALILCGWADGGKAYVETYDLNAFDGSATKEESISVQEKIKIDDFDKLQTDLAIGDLRILPSGDDSCYLAWRIPSKKGETAVEYRVRDGVLSIEERSAVSDTIYINIDFAEEILSGGKESETGVILYVPEKKVLKKIEVTMGFGDVQMNGIRAESGSLQNADGDITLFGCDMQNIKCKADYGDVELKSGTWENGSITLEDGDAKIQNTKLSGDVSVKNSYGDIDLELGEKDLEQLEITAKTDFGEIDVPDTMENLMQKEEDEQSFSYVPDQPAGRITLMTKDGDISLEND